MTCATVAAPHLTTAPPSAAMTKLCCCYCGRVAKARRIGAQRAPSRADAAELTRACHYRAHAGIRSRTEALHLCPAHRSTHRPVIATDQPFDETAFLHALEATGLDQQAALVRAAAPPPTAAGALLTQPPTPPPPQPLLLLQPSLPPPELHPHPPSSSPASASAASPVAAAAIDVILTAERVAASTLLEVGSHAARETLAVEVLAGSSFEREEAVTTADRRPTALAIGSATEDSVHLAQWTGSDADENAPVTPSSVVTAATTPLGATSPLNSAGERTGSHRLTPEQQVRAADARMRAILWLQQRSMRMRKEEIGFTESMASASTATAVFPFFSGAASLAAATSGSSGHPPFAATSGSSGHPSLSPIDTVCEVTSHLQTLLPEGRILALHGMAPFRPMPRRAASTDAGFDRREALRRLQEATAAVVRHLRTTPAVTPTPSPPPGDVHSLDASLPAAPVSRRRKRPADALAEEVEALALPLKSPGPQSHVLPAHDASGESGVVVVRDRLRRIRAQQQRLDEFAAFHQHAVTRTQDDAGLLAVAQVKLELRESALAPGLIGVFAVVDLPILFCCPYPGVLMPRALHTELHARYHVPTAVQLSTRRTLVGDPCALACLINGRTGNANVNVAFALEEEVGAAAASASASAQHEPTSVCVRSTRLIRAGEELGLDYGAGFWLHSERSEHHCQRCFAREASPFNEMFLCDGALPGGQPCPVGQHELCFDTALVVPSRAASQPWFCTEHARRRSPPHHRHRHRKEKTGSLLPATVRAGL
jgi:hypothetical protein